MKKVLSISKHILFLLAFVLALPGIGFAAPAKGAKGDKKPTLVLMPLKVSDVDKSMISSMETALVEGLSEKYEVFSGDKVRAKAKEIFNKESKAAVHKDCDETRCMQDIAVAFQAELIAVAAVTKRSDGFFIALNIKNIFDDKVVFSKSIPCKSCDEYQVIDQLKLISGGQPAQGDVKKIDYSSEFKEAPKWVFNPHAAVDKGFLAAVGVAKVEEGDIEGAKKRAFKIAVQEMAMTCAVNVQSLTKKYDDREMTSVFYNFTKAIQVKAPIQLLKQLLQAEGKKHWVSPSGDLYLLAVLNKQKIKKINLKQDIEWTGIVKSYMSKTSEGTMEHFDESFSIKEDDIWTDLISYEGTNDVADKNKVSIPINKAGAPDWVTNGGAASKAGEAISGVGSALLRNPNQIGASLLAARVRARNELAEKVEIKVSELITIKKDGYPNKFIFSQTLKDDVAADFYVTKTLKKDYVATDSEGKEEEKILEHRAKTVVNLTVSSTQKDLWVSPNGEIFVLISEEDSGVIASK